MPIPDHYSETDLKVWLHGTLGSLADLLNWTVEDASYDQAIVDTLLLYGISDIADATDIAKLQALARVALFRNAELAAAGLVDHSVLGDSIRLSQALTSIRKILDVAERQATSYGLVSASTVVVTGIEYVDDPYLLHTNPVTGVLE